MRSELTAPQHETSPEVMAAETSLSGDRQSAVRGQMTILFAVMATALLAFIALTIDGGQAFGERRAMQNAADAGSLAGTRQLASRSVGNPISDSQVHDAVLSAAEANGWHSSTGAITASYITTNRQPLGTVGSFGVAAPPAAAHGVAVTTTTTFDTFFGGFVGLSELQTGATARSIFGYLCSANCLMPVTVYTQTFTPGATYDFYGSNQGPGQFGWLHFTGGSQQDLCEDLTPGNCNSGGIEQGGWIRGSSGNNLGGCGGGESTETKLAQWVGRTAIIAIFGPGPGVSPVGVPGCGDAQTECPTGTCRASCGQGNNFHYHVVGFAAFQITGYENTANVKRIRGRYVNMLTDAELVPGCAAQSGIQAINLIR